MAEWAGDEGGCCSGRTRLLSSETSSLGERESTCATAPGCGWQSLRMRGKESSEAIGTQPSKSRAWGRGGTGVWHGVGRVVALQSVRSVTVSEVDGGSSQLL